MRFIEMNDRLFEYVVASGNPSRHDIADELGATTRSKFGGLAGMNIGADQGAFLAMLVHLTRATNVVEVGTFTGMSALWMAQALPDDGRLICFDITDEYLATARSAWEAAGVSDRIEVRIGPAIEGLAELADEPHIDLAFVDADKVGYRSYVEALLPRLREHGVIAVDNTLQGGRVADPDNDDPTVVAIREFNAWVAQHPNLSAVLLPFADGLTLISH